MLQITPLQEGELRVQGIVYNLCVEPSSAQKGSESPRVSSSSSSSSLRATLPSLAISSRDALYQRHQGNDVQASLSEGVQGRLEFRVRGPRLNSTKEEKSGIVYKEDYRLRWTVTPPMPKIVVRDEGCV